MAFRPEDEYLGQVPVGRIAAMTVTPGRSWQKLSIVLDGGHQVDLEARGASHALAAAFDQLERRPRPVTGPWCVKTCRVPGRPSGRLAPGHGTLMA